MDTRIARVEFDTVDGAIFLEMFRFSDTQSLFSIIDNCYATISNVYPDAQMVSFTTIE